MALDESGGYDLARGFDTLITTEKATEQAIRDLQASVMAVLAMQRDTTVGASGQSPSSMNPAAAAAVQPNPNSGQTIAAPGAPGRAGVETQGVTAQQPVRDVGDPQAGAVKPSPTGGITGPAALTEDSGSGMLDSVLNVLPFGDKISGAMSFFREQRDKNAQFQQIQGGSNKSMIAERAHQKAYQMSTAGMFSGAESDKAFMSVTALGYNQDYGGEGGGEGIGRQDALNFIGKQKSASGLSVDQSLQHLDTFTQSASAGLTQFSDALIQVGVAAGQAGSNALEAQAIFSQLFSVGNAAGLGQGATAASQTLTNMSSSYGTAFMEGADMTGALSEGVTRMQSAMRGSTYGDSIVASQAGINVTAQNSQKGIQQLVSTLNPGAIQWAKDQIAANPDMGEEEVTALADKLLARLNKGGLDPMSISTMYHDFTGIDVGSNVQLAMVAIVQFLMGNGPVAQAKKVGLVGLDEDGNQTDEYRDLGVIKTQTGSTPLTSGYGGSSGGEPIYEETTTATGLAYNAYRDAGGEGLGMLENVMGKLGAENLDSQMVKIGGKEYSLADIIENKKLRNKAALGKGTLVDGEFADETLGSLNALDVVDEDTGDLDTTATDVNVHIDLTQAAQEWFTANSDAEGNPRTES